MKQQLLPFPIADLHSDLFKYLLFVPPNQRVGNRINGIKRIAYGVCNGQGICTPPHITVTSIYAPEDSEPSLVRGLQELCNRHQQFMVHLQGYGGFDRADNSAFFIKIEEHQPFLELANDLRLLNVMLKNSGCRVASLVNNPHLTLVRGLSHSNYVKAMHFYSAKSFSDAFIVNKLMLIKRRIADGRSQLVTTFQLPFSHYLIN